MGRSSSRFARMRKAMAADVLRRVLHAQGVEVDDQTIGRIRSLGEGLSYKALYANCWLSGSDEGETLVVRLPRHDVPANQRMNAKREVKVLEQLAKLDLPIRIPKMLGVAPVETGLALVQTYVEGIPLEMRAKRLPGGRPWEPIAEVASICHRIDPEPFKAFLRGHPTRRTHAESALTVFGGVNGAELNDAKAWASEHLPPDEPASFLHGDLLGQNIRREPFEELPLGVIDWELARIGDPAYDLAIVTRGRKRPFQSLRGLRELLDSYNARADRELARPDVQFYEVCMHAAWVVEAEAEASGTPKTEQTLLELRSLLRRLRD